MKHSILTAFACLCALLNLNAQDTPSPPANLQVLPAGSYVIPMDNNLQSNDVIGAGNFNLKSYGLIIALLNSHIKLKWVMRAGKLKDEIDFTAAAEQFQPALVPGGVSRNFKAAPFVIFPEDTMGVSSIINSYNTARGLIGNDRPKVFRTTAAAPNVDIRYDMTGFIPKAAILTDGGNQRIHRDYMITAGITTANYREVAGVTLSDCFTFASEPHNDENGANMDSTIASIKRFVLSGRNFLAECAAVRSYENNAFGHFHTANGFADANDNLGTNVAFPFADLSYYQFEGPFNASNGGSLQNWTINNGVSNPASYVNATGTGIYSAVQAASVSKLVSGLGGLVFYLGNHEFKDKQPDEINGIRLYLNAFLTPTNPASLCGSVTVLPLNLVNFQGSMNTAKVWLNWTIAQNESVSRFEVERSTDGTNFILAGIVAGSAKTGTEAYPFTEIFLAEKLYYRLKIADKNGNHSYSKVLVFQNSAITESSIKIINNPVTDKLNISFQATGNEPVSIRVVDMTGRQVVQQTITSYKGSNQASISLPAAMNKGMYIADIFDGTNHATTKFIKN